MRSKRRLKSASGSTVAEMPGAIWLFIIGMLMPLIGFVTLSFRAIILYNGVRDAAYQAAIAESYTDAKKKAEEVLLADVSVKGVKVDPNEPRVWIIEKKTSDGTEFVQKGGVFPRKVLPEDHAYYFLILVNAQVDPLVNMGGNGFWKNIPGLTGPLQITDMSYQVYVENPTGLES